MDQFSFVGREDKLTALNNLLEKRTASLVVIKGRRRVGKSRLVEEFARGKTFYTFTGLVPTNKTTAQDQRDEFAAQLNQQGFPKISMDDWSNLFWFLADKVKKGRVIIIFDEISWMGAKDSTFLGKLKNAWDMRFKKNPKLILILCGSVSSWIEKNIISSTGYFGRISLKVTLEELSLKSCNKLLDHIGFRRSTLEKFMLLSLTGGVPWYIEQIDPKCDANENIRRLCFVKDGLLVDEFKFIFHDLFGKRGEICRRIVEHLEKGVAEYSRIVDALGYHSSGSLSDYLEDLLTTGFIKRDYMWNIKTGKDSRLSHFRLSDNYLRFYLKYISPNLNKINRGRFATISMSSFPGWSSVMGLQFENLVLNNRKLILEKLNIRLEDVVNDNPYFQRQTTKLKGCQIDYLIQTQFNTLFVCEIKFSRNEIKQSIIDEMQEKIKRLALPKGYACFPVLIHINGVSESVEYAEYFYQIINFSEFIE